MPDLSGRSEKERHRRDLSPLRPTDFISPDDETDDTNETGEDKNEEKKKEKKTITEDLTSDKCQILTPFSKRKKILIK